MAALGVNFSILYVERLKYFISDEFQIYEISHLLNVKATTYYRQKCSHFSAEKKLYQYALKKVSVGRVSLQ